MAEQTAVEFNFKRPDGSYGGAWTENQMTIEKAAQVCIDTLKAQGAQSQIVEIVTRTKTTSYSEESHFNSLSTD